MFIEKKYLFSALVFLSLLSTSLVSHAASKILDAGISHTCAIDANQAVQCWGTDFFGQASPPPGQFIQVTAGMHISCGIRTDNTLWCWGGSSQSTIPSNPEGQFIFVNANKVNTPSVCAVTIDNRIKCWGAFYENEKDNIPTEADFIEVYVGSTAQDSTGHACALRQNRTVVCWGTNDNPFRVLEPGMQGQVPAEVADTAFSSFEVGGWHNCGIIAETQAPYCWGVNDDTQIIPPPDTTLVDISTGIYSSCGITTEGRVSCWGWFGIENPLIAPPNADCICGREGHQDKCACIQTSGELFSEIATFTQHVCAVKLNRSGVTCWGENGREQAAVPTDLTLSTLLCEADATACEGNGGVVEPPVCRVIGLQRQTTPEDTLFAIAPEDFSITTTSPMGLVDLAEPPSSLAADKNATYFATRDAVYVSTDPAVTDSYRVLQNNTLQAIQDISVAPSGELWGWDAETGLWSMGLDAATTLPSADALTNVLAPPIGFTITHVTWHVSKPMLYGLQQNADAAPVLWSYQPNNGAVSTVCPEVVGQLSNISGMTAISDTLLMFTLGQRAHVQVLQLDACQIVLDEVVAPNLTDIAGLAWQCR